MHETLLRSVKSNVQAGKFAGWEHLLLIITIIYIVETRKNNSNSWVFIVVGAIGLLVVAFVVVLVVYKACPAYICKFYLLRMLH